jgi:hypothetical protein
MQKKYADKGVVIVALTDEPPSKVKPFAKTHKINYIVGMEAKETRAEYGVNGFPTALVVDPGGKILWRGHPMQPDAEEAIEKALEQSPPKQKKIAELRAGGALAKADKLFKEKQYAKAMKEYERVAKAYKGSDTGRKAADRLKAIKGDQKIMAVVRAEEARKKCENWLQMARTLAKNGKEAQAAEYYQRVLDEFPESEFADTAKAELDKLRG